MEDPVSIKTRLAKCREINQPRDGEMTERTKTSQESSTSESLSSSEQIGTPTSSQYEYWHDKQSGNIYCVNKSDGQNLTFAQINSPSQIDPSTLSFSSNPSLASRAMSGEGIEVGNISDVQNWFSSGNSS